MAKPRMTTFSRFMLTMLIIAPLAFMGANYATGKDGVQELKNLFNFGESVQEMPADRPNVDAANVDSKMVKELRKAKDDLKYKDDRIKELRRENEDLKIKIDKLEKQLSSDG